MLTVQAYVVTAIYTYALLWHNSAEYCTVINNAFYYVTTVKYVFKISIGFCWFSQYCNSFLGGGLRLLTSAHLIWRDIYFQNILYLLEAYLNLPLSLPEPSIPTHPVPSTPLSGLMTHLQGIHNQQKGPGLLALASRTANLIHCRDSYSHYSGGITGLLQPK